MQTIKEIKAEEIENIHKEFIRNHSQLIVDTYKMIVDGNSPSKVKRALKDGILSNGEYIDDKLVSSIIYEVQKLIIEDFNDERTNIKQKLYAMANDLYSDCKKMHDRANAKSVLDYIAKLTGAYEPDKVDANVNSTVTISFGFDDNDEDVIEDAN